MHILHTQPLTLLEQMASHTDSQSLIAICIHDHCNMLINLPTIIITDLNLSIHLVKFDPAVHVRGSFQSNIPYL